MDAGTRARLLRTLITQKLGRRNGFTGKARSRNVPSLNSATAFDANIYFGHTGAKIFFLYLLSASQKRKHTHTIHNTWQNQKPFTLTMLVYAERHRGYVKQQRLDCQTVLTRRDFTYRGFSTAVAVSRALASNVYGPLSWF